jgi:hypothetical protein
VADASRSARGTECVDPHGAVTLPGRERLGDREIRPRSRARHDAGKEERPDCPAVRTASRLRWAAGSAPVAITWMDTPLDAEFSPIREHRADAGLGWLTASPDTLAAPLDAMSLGQFEPEVWIPRSHPAARRGLIGLDELAGMDVIHGPRRAEPSTYDAWTAIVRTTRPRFEFTDPPLRYSLPVVLAFAATAGPSAAVLTGPVALADVPSGVIQLPRSAGTGDMVRVSIGGHPLTATAALVWSRDLPRPLQQILFDTAEGAAPPAPASLPRAS